MDERILIAAARRGDAESFNRLVRGHADVAYDVAYRLLGGAEAAEVMEEAAAVAYCALPALQGGAFRTWLLRCVVGACRRRALPQPCAPAALDSSPEDESRASGGDGPGHGEAPLGASLLQAVEAGIAALPLESRAVLVLADVQGLSCKEIAQVTGRAPAAVRQRLAEARTRLSDWLYGGQPGTRRTPGASFLQRHCVHTSGGRIADDKETACEEAS